MKKQQRYTALYERANLSDEGNGIIANQKQMLMDYAISHLLPFPCHFTDNGVSGSNFERPALKEMMKEIENGNISIVVIKDISRLGRDMVKVKHMLDLLSEHNVRLIAINDGIDTKKE